MHEKILVIEDNTLNRTLLRYLLEPLGYEVLEAEDGAAGIACARALKPDLILMDAQMPVIDGYTAMRILKADETTKNIKIIAITSFAMNGDREKALEAGADEYVSKPVNTKVLSTLIKKILGDAL
jgi:two-component system cell cycle response regulator DivK